MKHIVFALLAIISFSSFAQDNFKRFQIGVNFLPDVDYRLLQQNTSSSIGVKLIINQRNKVEVPKFGYTTGLNFCYNIKSFVGIEVGVQYSNKGYQSKKQDLYFDFNGSTYILTGDYFKYVDEFHYIDIPVKVNFTVGKKKVRFFTSVGLVTNMLVRANEVVVWTENGTIHKSTNNETKNCNRVNLSPMLSLGIDYKINNKMNLRVEPTARFGVLSVLDGSIKEYLYSGGLNLSYYFGL